jgi:hypothetical protein
MAINLSPLLLPIFFAVCFAAYVGIVIALMTFSMRAKLKDVKRIQDAQARGAFDDLNTHKLRHVWLPIAALVGVLGVAVTIGMLFLKLLQVIDLPVEIILLAFGVFGTMGAIAGTLMYQEIDRRL